MTFRKRRRAALDAFQSQPKSSREIAARLILVFGCPKGDLLTRLDLDRRAGGRIASHARRASSHHQHTKTHETDAVALLEVLGNQTDEVIENAFRLLLWHLMLLCQAGREMFEADSRFLRLIGSGLNWLRGNGWHGHDV